MSFYYPTCYVIDVIRLFGGNLDFPKIKKLKKGGSPGLVVMGGDSRSKGRGFESRRRILDGHDIFSHLIVVKLVLFV